ncbi:type II secretion system protein GspE [candidate division KSB1 bacterium]|nr:MAG: type II secretion system protein GspE [candidate division KSB1 bacterium]
MGKKNVLLGDLLVEQKLITPEQLKQALKHQQETGKLLGRALIDLKFIDEKTLIKVLHEKLDVPYVSLRNYKADPEVIKLVPEEFARAHKVLPLFRVNRKLTAAMVNPMDVVAIDALSQMVKMQIEPVICDEKDIEEALDQYYSGTGSLQDMAKDISVEEAEQEQPNEYVLRREAEEGPVVKLVNLILSQAVKEGASDIHIEPREKELVVRYRIDGILHEVLKPPKKTQLAMVSRIKILASLDIAERRLPQDGRFRVKFDGRDIDFRVSTFPTVFGENVVLRLLDNTQTMLGLEELGMDDEALKDFKEIIHRPYGIILVTGPTGSGKSTTLYAALRQLDSKEKNIITLEDPVEYHFDQIRQSQVNPRIGLTFATGLRAILRQDPDVIMVGEIRDSETADIAVKSALTGHLVFSTLHTNDAVSALTRLADMGVEPYLVSSAVQGILAQRLARRVCPDCKVKYQPDVKLLKGLGINIENSKLTFYRGKGCRRCKNTGFRGRIAIFEFLKMDDQLRRLVVEGKSAMEIKNEAIRRGMITLLKDGIRKTLKGLTTIEEVLRITQL